MNQWRKYRFEVGINLCVFGKKILLVYEDSGNVSNCENYGKVCKLSNTSAENKPYKLLRIRKKKHTSNFLTNPHNLRNLMKISQKLLRF